LYLDGSLYLDGGIWTAGGGRARASQGFKFIAAAEVTPKAGQNGHLPAAVGRTPKAVPADLKWGTLRLIRAVAGVIYV
jgi:hypothetical protein